MTDIDLSKHEGHRDSRAKPGVCICGDPWPCAISLLLAEVKRLREERAEWWRDEVEALRQSHARLLAAIKATLCDGACCEGLRAAVAEAVAEAESLNGK